MNIHYFTNQVTRLQQVFGVKTYPQQRVDEYWKMVHNIPDENFRKWVDQKIADSKFAPLGEEFRQVAKDYERYLFKEKARAAGNDISSFNQNDERHWKFEEHIICKRCRDDGALVAIKKLDGSQCTFVCDCPSGEYSHWAQPKKVKDEPPFHICRWRSLSPEIKSQYILAGEI